MDKSFLREAPWAFFKHRFGNRRAEIADMQKTDWKRLRYVLPGRALLHQVFLFTSVGYYAYRHKMSQKFSDNQQNIWL